MRTGVRNVANGDAPGGGGVLINPILAQPNKSSEHLSSDLSDLESDLLRDLEESNK